ncbi:MAG: TIGR00295 family protein [Methanobacteriota archaeon]
MIGRNRALRALHESGCHERVVRHCLTVERTAISIANRILANGHDIDLQLVSVGGLLHDIGRSKTHGIEHGVEGGKILRIMGLKGLARFAERHIGAGIPAGEARALGLPPRNFIPRTVEEKVVSYADKLAIGSRRGTYREALDLFKSELGPQHPAVDRFRRLHEEIQNLMKK